MHAKHAEVIKLMRSGYVFVQEVHAGFPRNYFLRSGENRIPVSEDVYYKMSELDYIETDGKQVVDKHTVFRFKRLTAKYRESNGGVK